MPSLLSVNLGRSRTIAGKATRTGIDKRAVAHAVELRAPGPKLSATCLGSGLVGDRVCNRKHHGGDDQAVYAYAREDLDAWQAELGIPLHAGAFGENLTTVGLDVTGARIGERWRIGAQVVLQVTAPRIPCRTFAVWLDRQGWIRRFLERGVPGAYFRIVVPGMIAAGDPITVEHRPDHHVTIERVFRALTLEPALLPGLLVAPELPEDLADHARRRAPIRVDPDV
jgi:MOSC domain-containing protein YiiM